MSALILCGVLWRVVSPGGLDAKTTRSALTGVVYYLFLPAMVLLVLWQAPLGLDSIKIALVATLGIVTSLLVIAGFCHVCGMDYPTRGAVMLAAAFPNATYLGLPVLEATFGKAARSIAIQFDLFACTPLLLTVGVWLASRYGTTNQAPSPIRSLMKVPALWAAFAAIVLNFLSVPIPDALKSFLQTLSQGVVPLMLISLGLSLTLPREQLYQLRSVFPALAVKLFFMPLVVLLAADLVRLHGMQFQSVVLEGAMPSMVLGMVLADRYGLNTAIYAAIVTISTVTAFFTLGMWFHLVS
jgi:predicted permease